MKKRIIENGREVGNDFPRIGWIKKIRGRRKAQDPAGDRRSVTRFNRNNGHDCKTERRSWPAIGTALFISLIRASLVPPPTFPASFVTVNTVTVPGSNVAAVESFCSLTFSQERVCTKETIACTTCPIHFEVSMKFFSASSNWPVWLG